jgi:hypothetical protein
LLAGIGKRNNVKRITTEADRLENAGRLSPAGASRLRSNMPRWRNQKGKWPVHHLIFSLSQHTLHAPRTWDLAERQINW